MTTTFTLTLSTKADIVEARHQTKQAAEKIGFPPIDRTKVTTAVSELARTVVHQAVGATMTVELLEELEKTGLMITVTIAEFDFPSTGHVTEKIGALSTDLDRELHHVKRLMNLYSITSEPGNRLVIKTGKWALK
ncbi:hypothetical protein M3212_15160 [Alkalihalobacillus oceani]|uniref:hypothetical protein n=1 Tax=Halalkalibacter oceani TaxID=1653776 RepID=UPI00203F0668|nr:hypothetical protein [Halalkalibacter oceani]MCM3762111.1 hypothetical protein [Halalkalibacter oceani]